MSYQLVPNAGSAPQNAVSYGYQNDSGAYYLAVAQTEWGTIPGKAQGNTCWFPYGGEEKRTENFSWVVAPYYALTVKRNDGSGAPYNALAIGQQNDATGTVFSAVAHTDYGKIPGKASRSGVCWFPYGGGEHQANSFDWVVTTNY